MYPKKMMRQKRQLIVMEVLMMTVLNSETEATFNNEESEAIDKEVNPSAESQATECYPNQSTTDGPSFSTEQYVPSWQDTITDIYSGMGEANNENNSNANANDE